MNTEGALWQCHVTVDKWDDDATEWVADKAGLLAPSRDDFAAHGVSPFETIVVPPPANLLTTVGLAQMTTTLLNTTGSRQWAAASAGAGYVGLCVGDSTTAAAVSDADLGAATNKSYQCCDNTYPSASNGTITFLTTFGGSTANWAWQEYGAYVGNASASTLTAASPATAKPGNYVLLNHKIQSLGTKSSGSTWAMTMTIAIS